MKPISSWTGLVYPDEYLTRFFFKFGLSRLTGRVLELGCGVGNNLALFRAFDWTVVGMDNDALSLESAKANLASDSDSECVLVYRDLEAEAISAQGGFDSVLIPNLACYLSRDRFIQVLAECKLLLNPGGSFFLKTRLVDDWRARRGPEVARNSYVLSTDVTGEQGATMTLYDRDELVALVTEHIGSLVESAELRTSYENVQSGIVIDNHDLVIWGRSSR